VRRRIAAVLMADVAGETQADSGAAPEETFREVVARGGGRVFAHPDGESLLLVEFPSAVEAVRAAVDARETLRARNRPLAPDRQVGIRFGLTIADVPEGEGEVPGETWDAAAHLVRTAAPGGICVSRSVREAASGKLNLDIPGLTVEGQPPETRSARRAGIARSPELSARGGSGWLSKALGIGLFAAEAGMPGVFASRALMTSEPAQPSAVIELPAKLERPQAGLDRAEVKAAVSREVSGVVEFKPAVAPDPAEVLTARRMLPNAWKDCHDANADIAVAGCKTVLASGIAKGRELADVLLAQGKAERERKELDKALESLTRAIEAAPAPMAFSLRGTVYYDKEKWEEAIADYTETIRRDPSNGEAYNNRAWTYYRIGRSDKALADAESAVRLLGKEAYVWDTRGHIHAELGHREAAISDFRAALAIDPTNVESKAGLARLGVD